MLLRALLAFANHVLASEDWATSRLARFAGQSVAIGFGSVSLPVTIGADGLLAAGLADPQSPATVTLTLPDDAPVRWLTDRAALLASAQIAGPADLAETLNFVMRHLRWDVESDLSLLFGDIVGRRTAQIIGALGQWQANARQRSLSSLGEYLSEESGVLATRREVERFCVSVGALADDCRRLESRLQRVESARPAY
ncbi:hypothetical protein [Accumulibacter sp.]|nr:hypothetical protein [Accumulibacter sp.]HMW80554.1 hypothetical protein [Accumulibacter sp.]HNI51316.1 hypothetical protein [Accumulibacter sp.]